MNNQETDKNQIICAIREAQRFLCPQISTKGTRNVNRQNCSFKGNCASSVIHPEDWEWMWLIAW